MKKIIFYFSILILSFLYPLNISIPPLGLFLISLSSIFMGLLFMSLIRYGSLIYRSNYFNKNETFSFSFVKNLAVSSITISFGFAMHTFFFENNINLLSLILIAFGVSVLIGLKIEKKLILSVR